MPVNCQPVLIHECDACWDQHGHRAQRSVERGRERYRVTYRTVVADPPWPYNNVDGPRAAPNHRPNSWNRPTGAVGSALRYGSLSIDALCSLGSGIAHQTSHLYLWTTNSFLVEAHIVARAWGFEPKTLLTWGKIKHDGTPSMKAGYYYRGATEHVLFAVRGRQRLLGPARPTLYLSPRLPHSVKPEWFYRLCEEQSPPPRVELFARRPRDGWNVWGNEVESNAAWNADT